MILSGNQGTVVINHKVAVKTYHNHSSISSQEYFLYEIENLSKISKYGGNLLGFQVPVLFDYDISEMTIKMSAVNLSLPYIVDFCPMIQELHIFEAFMQQVFTPYVCEQHGVPAYHHGVLMLKKCLYTLASECSIYYTDPKPSNARILPVMPKNYKVDGWVSLLHL